MSDQETPLQTAEGTAPEAPAAVAPAATATGAAERQPTPAAGTTPAAAAGEPKAKAKRFAVFFEGKEVEQTDSPIVAHARVQEGFNVKEGDKDYGEKLGVTPREQPATDA